MLYAVSVESVDWSRLDQAGNPRVTWRGCEAGCETGAADLVRGIEPTLLLRTDPDGRKRLAPYNLVTSWYWVEAEGEVPVPLELVQSVSQGRDGIEAIREGLAEEGAEAPRLKAEIQPYPIHHSVASGVWATRDCGECHDERSRLSQPMTLSPSPPTDGLPVLISHTGAELAGTLSLREEGALVYEPSPASAGLYVLGHDYVWWGNLVGIVAVLGTLLGVLAHAGVRRVASRKRSASVPDHGPPVYMYSTYERTWHWLQALAILVLIGTGIEIHVTRLGILDFALAVRIHNVVGFVVVANAVFAALYHLASGEIQHYLPKPRGFFGQALTQARYYVSGIFKGDPHPFEKRPDRKLNPLQQITYLVILNILLPLQMITGLLMWGAQRWPTVDGAFGGLVVLAPVHTFGAWLFAAFLIMHVYLTTTGPTPLAHIQAMVLGWEGKLTRETKAGSV
jgi:thiosulfate reductase cytochrome b subunit